MNRQTLFASSRLELLKLKLGDALRNMAGWILEKIHSPARLREFEFVDPLTNEIIFLSTGKHYSVLRIGDNHLFFNRLTGRFDGTTTSLQERVVDRLELFD